MKQAFQLCLFHPEHWPHGPAFAEIIETLEAGLRALGHPVIRSENLITPGYRTILLGAHVLPEAMVPQLPPDTILYNFEQAIANHAWSDLPYWHWMQRFEVWEYNHENLAVLRQRSPTARLHYVPMGYMPQLSRIAPRPDEDVDVLFYGSPSPRRQHILDALNAHGVRLATMRGVFGDERDAWIARAKIVLNIHMSDGGVFESPRIHYLLANRRCVVTECNRPNEIEDDLHPGLLAAPYASLVETCLHALADPPRRAAIAARGLACIQQPARWTSSILQTVLAAQAPPAAPHIAA